MGTRTRNGRPGKRQSEIDGLERFTTNGGATEPNRKLMSRTGSKEELESKEEVKIRYTGAQFFFANRRASSDKEANPDSVEATTAT
jgi:hypothetical protein